MLSKIHICFCQTSFLDEPFSHVELVEPDLLGLARLLTKLSFVSTELAALVRIGPGPQRAWRRSWQAARTTKP
jgi:hypothetical protein